MVYHGYNIMEEGSMYKAIHDDKWLSFRYILTMKIFRQMCKSTGSTVKTQSGGKASSKNIR